MKWERKEEYLLILVTTIFFKTCLFIFGAVLRKTFDKDMLDYFFNFCFIPINILGSLMKPIFRYIVQADIVYNPVDESGARNAE